MGGVHSLAPGIEICYDWSLSSEAATQDGTFTTYESISWCLAFHEKHANWLLCSGMYIHSNIIGPLYINLKAYRYTYMVYLSSLSYFPCT